jgi:hypothetical protein
MRREIPPPQKLAAASTEHRYQQIRTNENWQQTKPKGTRNRKAANPGSQYQQGEKGQGNEAVCGRSPGAGGRGERGRGGGPRPVPHGHPSARFGGGINSSGDGGALLFSVAALFFLLLGLLL